MGKCGGSLCGWIGKVVVCTEYIDGYVDGLDLPCYCRDNSRRNTCHLLLLL